jgi:uncharacterized protein (DUF427 family)
MESVWDYPRPPRLDPCAQRVRVRLGGVTVADSTAAFRVLETSHPPTIFVPPRDLRPGALTPAHARRTLCEWKGLAMYWDVRAGDAVAEAAGWSYPDPTPGWEAIRDHLSFYPSKLECFLDEERVRPQEGGFYGGWITDSITGPFKGPPGTLGW